MKFGLEKYGIFKMKCSKRQIAEGIDLANQESIRTLAENENY